MDSNERDFQVQLKEAGTKLFNPPDSVQELLAILDQVWFFLTKVEQSPSKSIQDALAPSINALVGEKLIRHFDIDVKASVASCISEITRITAPDAPYDDDRMKEVFQLIVASFEHLFDRSSPSYIKRTSTLETVAKVRSCVVMLDLECDDLIIEMFRHFLKSIRDYHPSKVFSSMETIMNLVLEESEDITPELLSPILASVKNDNKDVLPIARKLGERVLKCSATRVGQYLVHAVKVLGLSVDDYSEIVASICRTISDNASQNDESAAEPVADESNAEKPSLKGTKDANQGVQETAKESTSPRQANHVSSSSSKSIKSNVIAQTLGNNSLTDSDLPERQENLDPSAQDKAGILSRNDEQDNLDVNKAEIAEQNTERAGTSPAKLLAPSESTLLASEMESEKLADFEKKNKDVCTSSLGVHSLDLCVPKANDKEAGVPESKVISPLPSGKNETVENGSKSEIENQKEYLIKEVDRATDVVASKISDETNDPEANQTNRSKKGPSASLEEIETPIENLIIGENGSEPEVVKEKDVMKDGAKPADIASEIVKEKDVMKDGAKHADIASRMISDKTSDPEVNQPKRSANKARTFSSEEVKNPILVKPSKKGTVKNESETKKQKSKRVDAGNKSGAASSINQSEERKRQSLVNTTSKTPASKSSAKAEDKVSSKSTKSIKDEYGVVVTPKTNLKRKHQTEIEKEFRTKELGEDVVGSKIKVWWPKDKAFYKGVIDSFDPVKKRHKIAYDDGDVERLDLKREKYELIGDGSNSDKEEESDTSSLNMPSEEPLEKKRKLVVGLVSKSGGGTSRKSKSASFKASDKSRAGNKVDGKTKESNSGNKSKEDVGGKSKDPGSKSASKLKDADTSKSSNLKDGCVSTPNISSKSKKEAPKTGKTREETPRTASMSKGKSTKSGGKSDASGKMKSSLAKKKEKEDTKKSTNTKGKSPIVSKAQASKSKSGKKRRWS